MLRAFIFPGSYLEAVDLRRAYLSFSIHVFNAAAAGGAFVLLAI
jgi:hypothetical protein